MRASTATEVAGQYAGIHRSAALQEDRTITFKGDVQGSMVIGSPVFARLMSLLEMNGSAFEMKTHSVRPRRMVARTLAQRIDRRLAATGEDGELTAIATELHNLAEDNDHVTWDIAA